MKGCMILTIKNTKICVCERWVEACKLPRDRRNEMSCAGIHYKDHPQKKHLSIPLCENYINGKCSKIDCYYYHPIGNSIY